ncbi:NADH-dependent flavin oxidoreductase [Paenibacillaceae bacterium]|nr:NADH-dependent flavin oxidoreductase [Paenibacillaceae bacterium]
MNSFTFPNGRTIKNTLVMAPMTTYSSNKDEFFSEQELRYYENRSKDVGMLITAALSVSVDGHGFFNHVSLDSDRNVARFGEFTANLKNEGAVIVAQLIHAGKLALPAEIGENDVIAPSSIPTKRPGYAIPKEMTYEQAERIINDFYEATKRAIKAGFDGVELHGANGYLIQQFFSPYSNQRKDQWGGTIQNRLRFPLAVVQAVQKAVAELKPDHFIVGYRLSPEETGQTGIALSDTKLLINALIQQKIDYIHFSLRQFNQKGIRPETKNVEIGRELIDLINRRVPVIGVGKIKSLEAVIAARSYGYDLVAIGTALLFQPRFGKTIVENRPIKFKFSPFMLLKNDLPKGLFQFLKQVIQTELSGKLKNLWKRTEGDH